ncbi:MAG: hypothetical protein KGK07_12900 [Chloroflexota bacterium]|nr:hypothetical protein [Chloroflexota bacterium]
MMFQTLHFRSGMVARGSFEVVGVIPDVARINAAIDAGARLCLDLGWRGRPRLVAVTEVLTHDFAPRLLRARATVIESFGERPNTAVEFTLSRDQARYLIEQAERVLVPAPIASGLRGRLSR